jgi:S1-C subfamily serine protease
VAPGNEKLAEKYGHADESGVIITHVASGSAAQLAGIQPGSLITGIDRKPVHNMDEFQAAMQEAKKKDSVMLRIKQGELARFVVLKFQG